MKKVKLSKTQQEVIDLMGNGWQLGQSTSISSTRCWLQQGGLGRGGASKKVTSSTVRSLLKNGLIVSGGYGFPTKKYSLRRQ